MAQKLKKIVLSIEDIDHFIDYFHQNTTSELYRNYIDTIRAFYHQGENIRKLRAIATEALIPLLYPEYKALKKDEKKKKLSKYKKQYSQLKSAVNKVARKLYWKSDNPLRIGDTPLRIGVGKNNIFCFLAQTQEERIRDLELQLNVIEMNLKKYNLSITDALDPETFQQKRAELEKFIAQKGGLNKSIEDATALIGQEKVAALADPKFAEPEARDLEKELPPEAFEERTVSDQAQKGDNLFTDTEDVKDLMNLRDAAIAIAELREILEKIKEILDVSEFVEKEDIDFENIIELLELLKERAQQIKEALDKLDQLTVESKEQKEINEKQKEIQETQEQIQQIQEKNPENVKEIEKLKQEVEKHEEEIQEIQEKVQKRQIDIDEEIEEPEENAKDAIDISDTEGLLPVYRSVLIPGGKYKVSKIENKEKAGFYEELMKEFKIDNQLINNKLFSQFIYDTNYLTMAERRRFGWVFNLGHWQKSKRENRFVKRGMHKVFGANWQHPTGPDSNYRELMDYPVVQICYIDAMAYAKWAGKILPTLHQWEAATRPGGLNNPFPWGGGKSFSWDEVDSTKKCNCREANRFMLTHAGEYDPNEFKVFDQCGNVWELCSYPGMGDLCFVKGGSWYSYLEDSKITNLRRTSTTWFDNTIGFRCAEKA